MSNGILNEFQKEKCIKKLLEHLPTSSTNETLAKLSVIGTNVFESEKSHALRLISQVDQARGHFKKSDKNPQNIRLFWYKQSLEESNEDAQSGKNEGSGDKADGETHNEQQFFSNGAATSGLTTQNSSLMKE